MYFQLLFIIARERSQTKGGSGENSEGASRFKPAASWKECCKWTNDWTCSSFTIVSSHVKLHAVSHLISVLQANRDSLFESLKERVREHEKHAEKVRARKSERLSLSAFGADLDASSSAAGDASSGACAPTPMDVDSPRAARLAPPVVHSPFKPLPGSFNWPPCSTHVASSSAQTLLLLARSIRLLYSLVLLFAFVRSPTGSSSTITGPLDCHPNCQTCILLCLYSTRTCKCTFLASATSLEIKPHSLLPEPRCFYWTRADYHMSSHSSALNTSCYVVFLLPFLFFSTKPSILSVEIELSMLYTPSCVFEITDDSFILS